jgi:DNA-binding CsgD family transcriptional regulator
MELTVLQMAANGHTCKSSAVILGVGTERVKKLRQLALLKLGADHSAQAVAMAIRRGLIQ